MMNYRREKEQPAPGKENWIDYIFMTRRIQDKVLYATNVKTHTIATIMDLKEVSSIY
jgi:hypothetical protein